MKTAPAIPVILGPTASSKTSVGIELARLVDGEVISVDSRKVYRGLAIGTATPPGEWKKKAYWVEGVAHHLMAHLAPNHAYTAGDFVQDAERLIKEIQGRGKRPILVGGTGFYFKALQKGLPPLPTARPLLREALEIELKSKGSAALHAQLAERDPEAARNMSPNDRHKIIRALEVIQTSGRPFSEWKNNRKAAEHSFAVMAIDYPKAWLDHRIEERSRFMAERGMIEETAAVLAEGYSLNCPALQSFGYKEAVQVVTGELSRGGFLPLLVRGTKAYAKRQRTWFRTQTKPLWFRAEADSQSAEIAMRMKAFLDSLA